MTIARTVPLLLLAVLAALHAQENCWTSFPSDVVVVCGELTDTQQPRDPGASMKVPLCLALVKAAHES